ncbi:hypothetical protein [Phytohabitans kaempferiae]|uniref:Streptomycin biosynthesis protein StrG n=1 Tax=Phytohabitans kaempferiae TaxID=1620943 RepID=A0ABV6MFQ7_9ACTN
MLNKLVVGYDNESFDFAGSVGKRLGVADLSRWHEQVDLAGEEEPGFGNQRSDLHERLYASGDVFLPLFERFVATTVTSLVGEPVRYQPIPNWRVQLPGRHGVGEYHRDRDGGHNTEEMTFWVPLVAVSEDNCLWVESAEGRADFRPATMPYGKMLVFDSANLLHGNVRNGSDRTRVSFDFRVIPASAYREDLARPFHTGIGAPIEWVRS